MVRTLKITTMLIALLALGFIIFIAAKGIASDENIEKFLSTPGVAEQLQTGSARAKASGSDQETPLIRQAKAFALRIDPPPPPKPAAAKSSARTKPRRPKATVAAKFTLVGTSFHIGDEENSWALINEVGKGWHWVKQGEKAGHLIVEKIGDGVVLIRDGSKSYELAAEREQKADYVKSFTGTVESDRAVPSWQSAKKAVTQVESRQQTGVFDTETGQIAPKASPEVTKEELEENINWLKQLQENPESLGMTVEEAKELEGLGELLQSLETEIKTYESNDPNTEGKSDLAEAGPNAVDDSDSEAIEEANDLEFDKIRSIQDEDAPTPSGRLRDIR